MIIPNLMISNMAQSIAFYCDIIGMNVEMMVSADQKILTKGDEQQAVFTILKWQGDQLMLQTIASLSEDLPVFNAESKPTASGTLYFREVDPDEIAKKVNDDQIVKGPFQQWYGMNEIYVHDPDGYIICLGMPKGDEPV